MFSQKLKASIVKVNVEFENERVKGEITVLGWHKSKTSNENVKYQNLKLPLLRQKQTINPSCQERGQEGHWWALRSNGLLPAYLPPPSLPDSPGSEEGGVWRKWLEEI